MTYRSYNRLVAGSRNWLDRILPSVVANTEPDYIVSPGELWLSSSEHPKRIVFPDVALLAEELYRHGIERILVEVPPNFDGPRLARLLQFGLELTVLYEGSAADACHELGVTWASPESAFGMILEEQPCRPLSHKVASRLITPSSDCTAAQQQA